MSSFSESALEKKLSELSNSQQSVQTLSLWLIHHRKHAGPIVSVWHRELRKGTRGARRRDAGPADFARRPPPSRSPDRRRGLGRRAGGTRGRRRCSPLREGDGAEGPVPPPHGGRGALRVGRAKGL